jgi:hypothetical protein
VQRQVPLESKINDAGCQWRKKLALWKKPELAQLSIHWT